MWVITRSNLPAPVLSPPQQHIFPNMGFFSRFKSRREHRAPGPAPSVAGSSFGGESFFYSAASSHTPSISRSAYTYPSQRTVFPSYTTPRGSPMMHGFHPMMTPVHPTPPAQYAAPAQVYHHPAYATTPTYQVQPSPVIDHYALSFPSNTTAMQDVANFFASMSGFRADVNTSWVPYMVVPCHAAASMPYTYYLRPHGGHSGTTFPPGMSFMVGSDCQVTVTRNNGPLGYQHPSGFGHPPPPTGFYCYADPGAHYPPQSAPYPSAPNFNDYGRYEEPGSFGRRRRAYSSAGDYDESSSDEEDSEDEMTEEQGRSSRPTRSRTYRPSRRQSDPTDDRHHFNQTYSGRERSSRPGLDRNTQEPRPLPEMGFTDLLKDGRYKGRYFVVSTVGA